MDVIFPAIITAVGLVISALNLIHVLTQSRGKRFYERSIQLMDLRDRLRVLGALAGRSASDTASQAHQRLLADFDREARANATLYVLTVARLDKPGSYLFGFISLGYGLGTAIVTGSVASQLMEAGPVAVVTVTALPGLATLLLVWTGARLVLRRKRSLTIRAKMGEVDPLSKEGRRRFYSSMAVMLRKILRRATHEPSPSATVGPTS